MRREERIAYELHALVAAKVPERGEEIRAIGFGNLARMRLAGARGTQETWLNDWVALLQAPDAELINGMLDLTERGQGLRRMTPFAGVLEAGIITSDERVDAIQRGSRNSWKEQCSRAASSESLIARKRWGIVVPGSNIDTAGPAGSPGTSLPPPPSTSGTHRRPHPGRNGGEKVSGSS